MEGSHRYVGIVVVEHCQAYGAVGRPTVGLPVDPGREVSKRSAWALLFYSPGQNLLLFPAVVRGRTARRVRKCADIA